MLNILVLFQTKPTSEELGHCDFVRVEEIGETALVVFKQEKEESAVATIIIRGATDNIMDDIERAIDDGVNTFKAMSKVSTSHLVGNIADAVLWGGGYNFECKITGV